MNTYFSSDPHYSHKNIIRYCNRPYASVEEMNEALIANWNRVVTDEDVVYLLGDFIFDKQYHAQQVLNRLRGRKRLILGNHDPKWIVNLDGWESVNYNESINIGFLQVYLCHYPGKPKLAGIMYDLVLHGHTHGSEPSTKYQIDVGVDCWDYTPVSFEQILARRETLPEEAPASERKPRSAKLVTATEKELAYYSYKDENDNERS